MFLGTDLLLIVAFHSISFPLQSGGKEGVGRGEERFKFPRATHELYMSVYSEVLCLTDELDTIRPA